MASSRSIRKGMMMHVKRWAEEKAKVGLYWRTHVRDKILDVSSSMRLGRRERIQGPACQGPVITNNTFDHSVPQSEVQVTWGCVGMGSSNVDKARLAFHVASLSKLVETKLFKRTTLSLGKTVAKGGMTASKFALVKKKGRESNVKERLKP